MRIENDVKLDFSDVLLRPKRSTLGSRSEVDLVREYTFKHSGFKYQGIPIMASNMDTIGTLEMADALRKEQMSCVLHKHISNSNLKNVSSKNNFTFYSTGITKNDRDKFIELKKLLNCYVSFVCIDVANGYNENFIDFVKYFREEYKDTTIMAGNVVTPEVTEQLILAGADIVKVGIGSGSVCTTRKITGIGYPQLSAVIECADAAHGLGGHICSDGGCTVPGDIVKAFAAGADFVMLGGMLAGHNECGGKIVNILGEEFYEDFGRNDKAYMKFYGMSSEKAHKKYYGGVAEHRAAEGKDVLVPYKGPVINTLKEIMGGLRSACTYVGAKKLKELSKRATFVRVNRQLNEVFGNEI